MSDPDGSSAARAPSISTTSSSSASSTSTSPASSTSSAPSTTSSSTSLPPSSSSSVSVSSDHPLSSPSILALPSPYPFAAAPDIIRAHQKDAYFAGTLANDLTDLVRRFGGGRLAHAWATEARTAAELAYWGLTTWLGHRTLGEEYCDLVEVTTASSADSPLLPLPSAPRRTALVLGSVLAPYLVGRTLPGVRRALRRRLEAWVEREEARLAAKQALARRRRKKRGGVAATMKNESQPPSSVGLVVARYLLAHLDTLTSGTHVRAVTLALFYFYGAYYTMAARLLSIRYVFTRRREQPGSSGSSADDVVGYEVLGALLVLQLAVQSYMHVRDTLRSSSSPGGGGGGSAGDDSRSAAASLVTALGPVEVSLDHDHSYTANNELLLGLGGSGGGSGVGSGDEGHVAHTRAHEIARLTHTPPPPPDHLAGPGAAGPRFDLQPASRMRWLGSRAQRQCTLCLELLQDPAATPCGHVFCWRCIGDWVREKPECPLCRRGAQPQHILPLRAI